VKRVVLVVWAAVVVVLGGVAALAPLPEEVGGEDAPVRGLWSQWPSSDVGDPLRFYYFHEGGIGLYRYGKVGLNHTNSFDYRVDGDRLHLRFKKTGVAHDVTFRFVDADGARWLELQDDPRGPGTVRYRYVPPPAADDVESAEKSPLGGRLWIDEQPYATGGRGFALYQLNAGAIDGRGVGWFHEGDYDDWSTEALTYRTEGDRLELHFAVRGERAATRYALVGQGGERALVLAEDPRGFWHRRRFVDGGPSFGALSRPALGLYGPVGQR